MDLLSARVSGDLPRQGCHPVPWQEGQKKVERPDWARRSMGWQQVGQGSPSRPYTAKGLSPPALTYTIAAPSSRAMLSSSWHRIWVRIDPHCSAVTSDGRIQGESLARKQISLAAMLPKYLWTSVSPLNLPAMNPRTCVGRRKTVACF